MNVINGPRPGFLGIGRRARGRALYRHLRRHPELRCRRSRNCIISMPSGSSAAGVLSRRRPTLPGWRSNGRWSHVASPRRAATRGQLGWSCHSTGRCSDAWYTSLFRGDRLSGRTPATCCSPSAVRRRELNPAMKIVLSSVQPHRAPGHRLAASWPAATPATSLLAELGIRQAS